MELIATTIFGLEAIVARELQALGYADAKARHTGRVYFSSVDAAGICRSNLWLRCAERVLVLIGQFPATDFGQLYDQTYALPWEEWIPVDAEFPVKGRSVKSQLSSVPACQKMVKKAIVDKLSSVYGIDWFEETGAKYTVEISLLNDIATLTLDSSGPGLHKRGYRSLTSGAQLKETLAAALVQLSYWKDGKPLIDPFCGTGTIPIEAALIGRNIAPGINRSFISEHWHFVPEDAWVSARQEACDLAIPALSERIMGTDIDNEMLSMARFHAGKAGVENDIHFQQRDFCDLTSKQKYGCLIANPPYGERMGEQAEVDRLYRSMPEVLRRLRTWSHYILTSRRDFENLVGQPADRRRKLYNSKLECTYYQFHGPKPGGDKTGGKVADNGGDAASVIVSKSDTVINKKSNKVREQAFGGIAVKALSQAELFRNCLSRRARHLRKWPAKQGISCYRLYDRDIPEVPLVVDRYENWLHIAEHDRPHERTPAEHEDWLDLMAKTAGEVMETPTANIFIKKRGRQRGMQQYERVATEKHYVKVQEGGLRFFINLTDYVDTGLFLDHRITRSIIKKDAKGKRFLNLFGYTGSFSVYAAAGGAVATTTVDLSNTYLDWAADNMALNGFEGKLHKYIREDVKEFFAAHPKGEHYDLAVVDVPTFSNSKRTEEVWDVQQDHAALLIRLSELMSPGSVVYFSTNYRRFKFNEDEISELYTLREISKQTVPVDFRNRRIHRCWRLIVR